MRIGGLILALGVAILSLGVVSINTHEATTFVLTDKPLNMSIPPTARAYINVIENITNVTAYVIINYNGQSSIVEAPNTLLLTKGNYKIEVYKEGYFAKVRKIINQTVSLPCGNVTEQKIVNQTIYITTSNTTYPIYIHLVIYKMNIVEDKLLTEIIGSILFISGIILIALERINIL
ncbi:hypothetical protein DFR86_01515 [Acidianus sulfidivorans JP7]|uniref:PEGA domain-containing protein n=1 Tax=Acidianus sulfidivorans JP7 TaxID=619593 RepID=A0A2U9IKA1_9CREN|nr:hypothetical protein [Acidianus sulfidivorans]AWR96354.1 hypothetical protein DFR86_01515 [Acidianus sulfidivorans JP7]